mmetsp:Transcript_3956/g.11002  ORF Transcript_3956/g.11002 Transcript_3956/m.11002 type:complete len:237 (+) Transcript_3956:1094-1804(+)
MPMSCVHCESEVNEVETRKSVLEVNKNIAWCCVAVKCHVGNMIKRGHELIKQLMRETTSLPQVGGLVLLQEGAELLTWKLGHGNPHAPRVVLLIADDFSFLCDEFGQPAQRLLSSRSGPEFHKQFALKLGILQRRFRPTQNFLDRHLTVGSGHCTPHDAEAPLPEGRRNLERVAIDFKLKARSQLIRLRHLRKLQRAWRFGHLPRQCLLDQRQLWLGEATGDAWRRAGVVAPGYQR